MHRQSPAIAGAVVRLPESSSISPSVRDALAVIHRQAVELIVHGASLEMVLDALCDGIDALDPDLMSSVLLADPDGQRLWPIALLAIERQRSRAALTSALGAVRKSESELRTMVDMIPQMISGSFTASTRACRATNNSAPCVICWTMASSVMRD